MRKEKYIGLMSGTSLDGIDVVLCEISKKGCALMASDEHPFPPMLKDEILALVSSPVPIRNAGVLDHKLGTLFAEAVRHFMEKEEIDPASIRAIGSHGQTVWHAPEGAYPFSMQLGDPNIIAVETGISVVADFRRKDMALGGSGAPFAPAFHKFLLGTDDGSVCVVNIGGIANITVLGKPLIGYDSGPGNMLMDAWALKHRGVPYDKDGAWAREGHVIYPLLDAMMDDPYFSQSYPKSTGREKFDLEWIMAHCRVLSPDNIPPKPGEEDAARSQSSTVKKQDVQRTLLELTALSIANEVLKFNPDILMLCGGGAKNGFLLERMEALMPNVQLGVMEHADSLEAMAFAWLAYKRIHREHVDLKAVTGAKANGILGGIYV